MSPDAVSASELRRFIIDATVVEVFVFGIYTCLFLFTVYIILEQSKHRSHKEWFSRLFLLSLSYTCSATHCGLTWWYTSSMFETFGGSSDFIPQFEGGQPTYFIALGSIAFLFNTVIADSISTWRCWTLVGKRIVFVLLPILAIITGSILCLLAVSAHVQEVKHATTPNVTVNTLFESFFTPYLCLSLASTLYTTTLVVVRILLMYREFLGALPFVSSAGSIKRATEVIVESALIYSLAHIIAVAYLLRGSLAFLFAQNILPQAAGIAPALIILRVSLGYTRPTTSEAVGSVSLHLSVPSSGEGSTNNPVNSVKEIRNVV